MKNFRNKLVITSVTIISSFLLMLGLVQPITTFAATTPTLGTEATYGILTGTFNYNTGLTSVIGTTGQPALGVTGAFPGAGASLSITGTTETGTTAYNTAGSNQATLLSNLNGQACGNGGSIPGYTFAAGAIDLATDTTHGAINHYSPGVYCVTGAMSVGTAGIVLDTVGTYIFRSTGAFDTVTGSIVSLGAGVSECDVFWTPGGATTMAANTTFVGTLIDNAGITIGHIVDWTGRALAYAAGLGVISADTDSITVPTCSIPDTTPPVITLTGTTSPIIIGGTYTELGAIATDDVDAPFAATPSGSVNTAVVGSYIITYNATDSAGNPATAVTRTVKVVAVHYGGGSVSYSSTQTSNLSLTVDKIVNPKILKNGPGLVLYTYTLNNTGDVPLSDVKLIDDTCASVKHISGDTNTDTKLDVDETWIYQCSMIIYKTHTNTVVVTGWNNGNSTTAKGEATVSVSIPATVPSDSVESVSSTTTTTSVTATNIITSGSTIVPKLPNAGFEPQEKSNMWNIIITVSMIMLTITLSFIIGKKYKLL